MKSQSVVIVAISLLIFCLCLASSAIAGMRFNALTSQWKSSGPNNNSQPGDTFSPSGHGYVNPRTGEFLNQAGPSGYTGTRDGRYYIDTGGGLINSQTGTIYPK